MQSFIRKKRDVGGKHSMLVYEYCFSSNVKNLLSQGNYKQMLSKKMRRKKRQLKSAVTTDHHKKEENKWLYIGFHS